MLIDTNGNDGRILTTAPLVGATPPGLGSSRLGSHLRRGRDRRHSGHLDRFARRFERRKNPPLLGAVRVDRRSGVVARREFSIAFVRTVGDDDGDGTSTVEVVDVATGVSAVVVSTSTTWYPFVPRWSPSGKGIVYESIEFASAMLAEERVLSATINVVDLIAPDPASVAITDPSERATHADWSPDGEHIVFGLPRSPDQPDGSADLFIVEPTGGARTQLTTMAADGGRAIHPTWTPEGDGVVYVAEAVPFEEPTIVIVATDGTGSMTTVSGVNATHPRLQPSPGGG